MSLYSISDYGRMLADRIRVDAYSEALRRAVRPDSVVLDLGAGTGFLAMLAARLGAARVFAIEISDAIQIARETAAANGLADCIEFLNGDAHDLELPEPANLLVCDIRGFLPWALGSVSTLIDVRRRMLAPGATVIPRRDSVRVSVVEAAESYKAYTGVWSSKPQGLDIEVGRRFAVNRWQRERLRPEQVLTEVGVGAVLDYAATEDPSMVTQVRLEVARRGTGHGLAAWFDCDLDGEVSYSSGPDNPGSVYRQGLFFWDEAVDLEPGDSIEVELRATFVNGSYLWSWSSSVFDGSGELRAEFRQSAFHNFFPSEEHRKKRSSTFQPELTEGGRTLRVALIAMNEGRALGDVASELRQRFPDRFASDSEALAYVGDLSVRYSR